MTSDSHQRDRFLRFVFDLNRTKEIYCDRPFPSTIAVRRFNFERTSLSSPSTSLRTGIPALLLFDPPSLSNAERWKQISNMLAPGGYVIAVLRERASGELKSFFDRSGFRDVEFYANWHGDRSDRSSDAAIAFLRRDWGRGCPTGREPISLVDRIWIRELGEPLVDVRKACPKMHVRAKLPWLRESVAQMLNEAARQLPRGHRLSVRTCLRTIEMQKKGYQRYLRRMRRLHPKWPKAVLLREAYRFFHPFDHRVPPGHCTGGAVDVGIIGPDRKPLDFTSPLPRGMPHCRPYASGLSPVARRNRDMLIHAMESAGFSNCVDEYWHYSYGDAPWAVRMGKPVSWYGLAELPREARQRHARIT